MNCVCRELYLISGDETLWKKHLLHICHDTTLFDIYESEYKEWEGENREGSEYLVQFYWKRKFEKCRNASIHIPERPSLPIQLPQALMEQIYIVLLIFILFSQLVLFFFFTSWWWVRRMLGNGLS